MPYIWISDRRLYLAGILNLYSQQVVSRAANEQMKRNLTIRALDMAVALRQCLEEALTIYAIANTHFDHRPKTLAFINFRSLQA